MKNTSVPYFCIFIAAIALSQSCADPAQPVDNGTTVATSSFAGAEGNCPNGGIKLEISRDGEIQPDQTQYICNGTQGQDGKKASILTMNFEGAQGNCSNGGVRVDILVDGQVQPDQTQYICNGANGQDGKDGQDGQDGQDGANAKNASIKTTAFTDTQGTCTNGGVKVEVLIDDEVQADQTQYICNGANGQDGKDGQNIDGANGKNASIQTTAFTGAQGTCTNGGVKVDILIDDEVQADQTQYICNGTNGQDGQNGSDGKNASIQTSTFTGAQGSCTNGGVKVEVFIDGVVQAGQTQYICNGTNIKDGEDASCDLTQAECNAHKTVLNKAKCQCSSYFTFGHYEQDNNTTNGKEPISWRVLDIKNGKVLLISEKALDVQSYNTTKITITWAKSTIRSWLNGYAESYNTIGTSFTSDNFIDTAFTAEEKAKIVATNVPAHDNLSYGTSPGSATTDKIFLLSITEATNYFKDNADRLADATRYAVKKGAHVKGSSSGNVSSNGTCTDAHCYSDWWLRSPGYDSNYAAYVNYDGSIYSNGILVNYVLNYSLAVRPALWVNL